MGTRSRLPNLLVVAVWAALAAANVVAQRCACEWETVPFQLAWAAVTLLYVARARGLASLVATSLVTAGALAWTAMNEQPGAEQLSELPLMVGLFVAVVWIGARRQARSDALRQRAEHEREFLRDASHQLRTPITIARGHAELLRASAPTGELADDADVLVQELDRLSRLSDRLLLLAAAETPGFLWLEPVELEQLVVETMRRWSAAADRRWAVEIGVEGMIVADRERLATALDALIENAVKFTDRGDTIRLTGGGDGVRAVIGIEDTGAGIAGPDLARVFERFERGGGRKPGTGLGLAIVRAIVEAHGGSVTLASTPGQGTRFQVALPRFTSFDRARPDDGPMTNVSAASESAAA
ncbi:MAG: sensor histidine kinase [Gaiellaceae bacterium]